MSASDRDDIARLRERLSVIASPRRVVLDGSVRAEEYNRKIAGWLDEVGVDDPRVPDDGGRRS